MRRFNRAPFLVAALTAIASPATGDGLISPFGGDAVTLGAEERALLGQSIVAVLDRYQAGAVSSWTGPGGSHAGRAELLRTFERQGLPCAEVEHRFTAGGGNPYTMPFCRVASGDWKIAP
jgi:hypothetical protein